MKGKQLPEKFLERLTEMFGVSLFREIEKTFVERRTTFRINTIKSKKEEVIEVLNQNGFKIRQVTWYKDAFVLLNKSKRELTDLDIYNEGKIYIQSLASMIPPLVLDPQPGEKVLDLTAAPGSKTSQIAALIGCVGEIVANDNNKIRFFKLKHNMEVLGVTNTPRPAVAGHPSPRGDFSTSLLEEGVPRGGREVFAWQFTLRMEHGGALCREYPEYFDKILLDAPCSAEARFIAGEPKTHGYWKEQKIKEMAYKQWGLLLAAWSALKPGGTLVYSTCTFAPEENELQITKFLERVKDGEILPAQGGSASGGDIELKDVKRLPIVKTWPSSAKATAGKKNKVVNPEVVKKAMRIMPTREIEGFFVVKIMKH